MKKLQTFLIIAILTTIRTFAVDFKYGELNFTILSEEEATCEVKAGDAFGHPGSAVQGNVVIPSKANYSEKNYTVIAIGERAFGGHLTSVVIPNSVTTIKKYAFAGCDELVSLNIPSSVTLIEGDESAGWFPGCYNIIAVNVDEDNPVYSSINGCLYNKNKTVLLHVPQAKEGALVIPSSVNTVDNGACLNCTNLTSIEIPNSVTSIGNSAFAACWGITSFELPESLVEIGRGAFALCEGITSIVIPNSVKSIQSGAFSGCQHLATVTIGSGVTSIEPGAFRQLPNLKTVNCIANKPPKCNQVFDSYQLYNKECIYLVGSPTNWAAPIGANSNVLSQWRLLKNEGTEALYSAVLDMPSAPNFRFYSDLTGWDGGASIGFGDENAPEELDVSPLEMELPLAPNKHSFNFTKLEAGRYQIIADLFTWRIYIRPEDYVHKVNRPTHLEIPILHIPQGTKGLYSSEWPDFADMVDDLTAESSGIENTVIGADATCQNGQVTVYDLSGRCVLKNVAPEHVRSLDKGIYIVNGKKTLVK